MEYLRQRPILGPRLDRLRPRQVLIHARPTMRAEILGRRLDFFNALADLAELHRLPVRLVEASEANRAAAARDGTNLHVIMGAAGPLQGPHVLHACPTYLHGFWYLDPLGARHHSSIGALAFDPGTVPGEAAESFRRRLFAALAEENRSKYPQPGRGGVALERGSVALFAQEPIPSTEGQFHIELPELIAAAIAHRGGRRVYIKPHPRQRPELLARINAFHDPSAGVEVVEASVHDLLDACAFSVSQASAAAFEGFLHEKPAILAGRTDFGQNAVTITTADQMAAAVAEVTSRAFEHARFLYWFLAERCLEPAAPEFTERLAARIRDRGFPL